jgi:hypothetical protein
MKKYVLSFVVLAGLVLCMTGCDPEKTGGGGQMQPYDPGTGQYK